jgi:hypothetical protein
MNPEMNMLAQRVERLERQNRILKRASITVLLLIAVASLSAQSRPTRTIEAEKFVLLGSQGRARITIGTPTSSGIAIDTPADEPSIWISDAKGMDRVIVTTDGVRLANDAGRPAASLTFMKKTGGQVRLYSDSGKLLYHAPE